MAFKPIKIVLEGIDKLTNVLEGPMKKLDKLGKDTGKIGKALTLGVSLPILAAGAASVKFANDLNTSMANVATMIPNNTARVLELKGVVQDLSIAMGKTSTEVAGGLYQVISTFGDSADTAKILEINTKAAAAGLSTVEEAMLFTGAVTKAYGDTSATAMQKVADLGFQTVNLGVTTFPELAASIGSVTPLAKVMGVSLEELFAVMATASGVTGDTSEVSTQLASVLTALIRPTETMQSLFEHLGYASGQAMMKDLGFVKTMETLVSKSKTANISLGELLGRREAMILALSLTGAQAGELGKKMTAMENVSGALNQAFKEQTQGIGKLGFTIAQVQARLVVLAQKFGDKLAPSINIALDRLTPFIDKLTNISPTGMTVIIALAGIVAAIGPLLLAFSGAIGFIVNFNRLLTDIPFVAKMASTALHGLGAAFKFAFANPIGLAILAIVIWVNNIRLLIKNWDSITSAFSSKFMILQTLNFFFADIAKSIGTILSYIPGLGKLGEIFNFIGKGFEKNTQVLAEQEYGGNKLLPVEALREKYGIQNTNMSKSEILVKFGNMPKGVRVERTEGDVGIETEFGSALASAF